MKTTTSIYVANLHKEYGQRVLTIYGNEKLVACSLDHEIFSQLIYF